jgi:hypothetical protein
MSGAMLVLIVIMAACFVVGIFLDTPFAVQVRKSR